MVDIKMKANKQGGGGCASGKHSHRHPAFVYLVLSILMLFIISCQTHDDDAGNGVESYPQQNGDHNIEHNTSGQGTGDITGTEPEYVDPERQKHLDMLSDFDYLANLMEETFHYFGVAKRTLGLDVEALIRDTRAKIENYPESMLEFAGEIGLTIDDMPAMDEQVFWSIVYNDFILKFESGPWDYPLAHMGSLTFASYFSPRRVNIVNGRRDEDVIYDLYDKQRELYYMLQDEDPQLFHFLFRFDPEITDTEKWVINQNLELQTPQYDTVTTEIIEENRIAYIQFTDFNTDLRGYTSQLNDFYKSIQNYENLIIDIRECAGGNGNAGFSYIMDPLWRDREYTPDMLLFMFLKNADRIASRGVTMINDATSTMHLWRAETFLQPVDDILDTYSMNDRNRDDFDEFVYGSILSADIKNISAADRLNTPDFAPFNGQIWLLVSEKNYSSSAIFAYHAKYMEFATLVGETVGGGMTTSPPRAYKLPNSGMLVYWDMEYLTDRSGRSLVEFPVTPDFKNIGGMDSLETVLQLIYEFTI